MKLIGLFWKKLKYDTSNQNPMKTLKITFNKEVCIGNASCAALSPDNFEMHGSKSSLIGSKETAKHIFVKEIKTNDKKYNEIIEAAKACPVNAIVVEDRDSGKIMVGNRVEKSGAKEITAEYDDSKEFTIDKEGYFLIRIDGGKKLIEAAFCTGKNRIKFIVRGRKPIDIYHTILAKEKLKIRPEHAAYLGRELERAYIALHNNLEYTQDEELKF